MVPVIVGGVALIALVAAKGRPSTLFRVVEDGAVGATKGVVRGTKSFGRSVRIEVEARQLARAAKRVAAQDVAISKMSTVERAQHAEDTAHILRRAAELRGLKVVDVE